MDVFEAIRTRRSTRRLKAELPSKDLIERILEAGTWAPNHRLTQPWRFFVLTGNALKRLGDAMADALQDELQDLGTPESRVRLEAERSKPLRASVVIAVAVIPSDNPSVDEVEEYAAVAMAVQNMLLAAHALGLGSILRTGKAVHRKKINEFFGLRGRERLFGFIYLGYPAGAPPTGSRTSFREKTVWRE